MFPKILLIISLFIIQKNALSQGGFCHVDSIHKKKLLNPDYLLASQKFEQDIKDQSAMFSTVSGIIKTIPIVVHIIHHGGVENISDNQVLSQMAVLNKDFRRLNSDTVNTNNIFKNIAADIELEFCLASKDPAGNPTSGINRIYTSNTTLPIHDMIKLYGWDFTKYINIYVSSQIGAFGSFPWDPDSTQGIYISHGRFGTTGTAGTEPGAEYGKFGRTIVHEVGHYLGLYHTFSMCGDDGDYVSDTPPVDMRWWVADCLGHDQNSCSESPDLPDQVDNYMDYNIDSCTNMFSVGQKTRMTASLNLYRSNLCSSSNLIATGCSGVTGIIEKIDARNVTVFPNPANQHATLTFDNSKNENHTLILYDTEGRVVRTITGITKDTIEIERQDLPNGLYFFQVRTHNDIRAIGKLAIE